MQRAGLWVKVSGVQSWLPYMLTKQVPSLSISVLIRHPSFWTLVIRSKCHEKGSVSDKLMLSGPLASLLSHPGNHLGRQPGEEDDPPSGKPQIWVVVEPLTTCDRGWARDPPSRKLSNSCKSGKNHLPCWCLKVEEAQLLPWLRGKFSNIHSKYHTHILSHLQWTLAFYLHKG